MKWFEFRTKKLEISSICHSKSIFSFILKINDEKEILLLKRKLINLICKIQLWQILLFYCPAAAAMWFAIVEHCPSEEMFVYYGFGSFAAVLVPVVLVQVIQCCEYLTKIPNRHKNTHQTDHISDSFAETT